MVYEIWLMGETPVYVMVEAESMEEAQKKALAEYPDRRITVIKEAQIDALIK